MKQRRKGERITVCLIDILPHRAMLYRRKLYFWLYNVQDPDRYSSDYAGTTHLASVRLEAPPMATTLPNNLNYTGSG